MGGRAGTRFGVLIVVALIATLAIPSLASAQATRTWVSGVGDDANPCSRTAPCKTFAGALDNTAAKGEINCLDPGGFGGVTITKSLTIRCDYTEGGVLVSGTNAIVVNAAASDRVRLIGLDVNGIGTGLHGIRILQAKSVKIRNTDVYGFVRNGIDFEPSNAGATLLVQDVSVHDVTGNGVAVAPASTGSAKATIRNSVFSGNSCGILAAGHGMDPAFQFGANCGANVSGNSAAASVHASGNTVSDNSGFGLAAIGPNAVQRFGRNDIFGNAVGLKAIGGGSLLSYGNNAVDGNDVDGNPTGRVEPR